MKKSMTTVVCVLALIFSISAVSTFANISGSTLTAVTKYTPGETNTLVFRCDAVTPDWEYMYTVVIHYLAGMNVTAGEPATGDVNGGTFSYTGAVGDAAIARWDSDENLGAGYGSLVNGESANFTNEVIINAALSGDLVLNYELFGDGYGAAPHSLTGTVTLEESIPVTIDDFSVVQTTNGTVDDAGILGGERDLDESSGGNGTIGSGIAQCQANLLETCRVIYDGDDNDSQTDAKPGFASTDFTAGGVTSFDFPFTLTSGISNVNVEFCDSIPNCFSYPNLVDTPDSITLSYPHANFTGVDFTDITFLSINMAAQADSTDCYMGTLSTPVELLKFEIE